MVFHIGVSVNLLKEYRENNTLVLDYTTVYCYESEKHVGKTMFQQHQREQIQQIIKHKYTHVEFNLFMGEAKEFNGILVYCKNH